MELKRIALESLSRTRAGRLIGYVPFARRACKQFILTTRKYCGLFFGIYDTFEQAWADVPKSRLRGWDHPEAASIWAEHVDFVKPSTYPVFFWLSRLLRENSTLIDYGGSIGITYYGYRRRTSMPAGAQWVVVELPELVAQGRKTAAQQNAADLQFSTDLASVPEADILLSAGALQFMSESVPGLLEKLTARPRHIILNKIPLNRGPAFWTLHNFGPAVTPFRVYNECEFVRYFEQAGYKIRDRWNNNEMSCDIPFHPDRTVAEYTGLYLERTT